jgi:uncharacterized protein with GYD domain
LARIVRRVWYPERVATRPLCKEATMATYMLLTKLSPDAVKDAKTYEQLGRAVTERIHRECPNVHWISSYTTLGPYDYVDIFEAPDAETATKVALIIRSFGHATTETWLATPYERFIEMTREVGR